jgi:hypothetical protein
MNYAPEDFDDSYDWSNVVGYGNPATIAGVPGDEVKGYSFDDIDRVIAWYEGENDGPNWLLLVALNDGRFAYTSAGCDYTGWDCQASGYTTIHKDFSTLVLMGIPEDDRNAILLNQVVTPKRTGLTVKAIERFFDRLIREQDEYYSGGPNVTVEVNGRKVTVEVSDMYSRPLEGNYATLQKIGKFFNTLKINVDHWDSRGCESCDHGSDYGISFDIWLDEGTKIDTGDN